MLRHCLAPLLLFAATAVSAQAPASARPATADEAAVRAVLEHYMQGHATGDGAHWSMIFHPVSMLFWADGGKFRSRTGIEFAAAAGGSPAPDEAQRKRRIVFVDVDGDAAVGKVELDYPEVRFADYFTLAKLDGEWKVMNKTFSRQAKPKP